MTITFDVLDRFQENKEHVQLRFGVQKRAYFENSGLNWSKLGSIVDKHHMLHVIDLIFG